MSSEPNGVTMLESELALICQSIQGHESILRCNFPNVNNELIREMVNNLWNTHYWKVKALAYELLLEQTASGR